MIDVDFIDQILIFDDISNVEEKCDHSNLLVRGFIVGRSNFLFHDYNFRKREVAISPINSW